MICVAQYAEMCDKLLSLRSGSTGSVHMLFWQTFPLSEMVFFVMTLCGFVGRYQHFWGAHL
jgi:hypothetical protein